MLCSELTSHWCISQAPGRLELAVSCHNSDALMGSRTAAMTWSPRARSWRTNSRPIPTERHSKLVSLAAFYAREGYIEAVFPGLVADCEVEGGGGVPLLLPTMHQTFEPISARTLIEKGK
jgi:hypothetical protein